MLNIHLLCYKEFQEGRKLKFKVLVAQSYLTLRTHGL